jgi:hypothetical protein
MKEIENDDEQKDGALAIAKRVGKTTGKGAI